MLFSDRATYLGSAPMPEPARPPGSKSPSGGMDAEWVEIEGVVVSASTSRIILLTRDGRIQINDNLAYPLPVHHMTPGRAGRAVGQRCPGCAASSLRIGMAPAAVNAGSACSERDDDGGRSGPEIPSPPRLF